MELLRAIEKYQDRLCGMYITLPLLLSHLMWRYMGQKMDRKGVGVFLFVEFYIFSTMG
jgi:hypothetical protein